MINNNIIINYKNNTFQLQNIQKLDYNNKKII